MSFPWGDLLAFADSLITLQFWSVDLGGNGIPQDAFAGLHNLEALDFRSNNLATFNHAMPANLVWFFLWDQNIETLDLAILSECKDSLQNMFLDNHSRLQLITAPSDLVLSVLGTLDINQQGVGAVPQLDLDFPTQFPSVFHLLLEGFGLNEIPPDLMEMPAYSELPRSLKQCNH